MAVEYSGISICVLCKKCNTKFCWICLGYWEWHDNPSSLFDCSRYNDEDVKLRLTAQEKSKADLLRYSKYNDKFTHHMEFLNYESNLFQQIVLEKFQKMQD